MTIKKRVFKGSNVSDRGENDYDNETNSSHVSWIKTTAEFGGTQGPLAPVKNATLKAE